MYFWCIAAISDVSMALVSLVSSVNNAIAIADLRHTSFQIALSAAQSHIEQVRIEQRQQDLVRLEVAVASHGISGTEWQVH